MNKVQSQSHTKRGFTLFEVIVSLAIFTLLTTTVLIKHSKFKGDILLLNLSTQVALSIREAQVNSLSVKGQAGAYTYGYGVHFTSADKEHYYQFVDLNTNGVYDSGTDTLIETATLPKGHTLSKFCAYSGTVNRGSELVTDCTGSGSTVSKLNITFRRPNPDSYIVREHTTNAVVPMPNARIYVRSANGNEKSVRITGLGLITVEE